jgi:hypothetical protein
MTGDSMTMDTPTQTLTYASTLTSLQERYLNIARLLINTEDCQFHISSFLDGMPEYEPYGNVYGNLRNHPLMIWRGGSIFELKTNDVEISDEAQRWLYARDKLKMAQETLDVYKRRLELAHETRDAQRCKYQNACDNLDTSVSVYEQALSNYRTADLAVAEQLNIVAMQTGQVRQLQSEYARICVDNAQSIL